MKFTIFLIAFNLNVILTFAATCKNINFSDGGYERIKECLFVRNLILKTIEEAKLPERSPDYTHVVTPSATGAFCTELKDVFEFDENSEIEISYYLFTNNHPSAYYEFEIVLLDSSDKTVQAWPITTNKDEWGTYVAKIGEAVTGRLQLEVGINEFVSFGIDYIRVLNENMEEEECKRPLVTEPPEPTEPTEPTEEPTEPTEPTEEPTEPTEEPTEPTEEPTEPTEPTEEPTEPTEPTEEPTEPTEEPTEPTEPTEEPTEPTEPTEEPTEPTEPTEEPTEPTEEPTEPTEEPTEPTEPTEEPTEPTEEPTEPTEPTEEPTEPTEPTKEPTKPTIPPELTTDPTETSRDTSTKNPATTPETPTGTPNRNDERMWMILALVSMGLFTFSTLVAIYLYFKARQYLKARKTSISSADTLRTLPRLEISSEPVAYLGHLGTPTIVGKHVLNNYDKKSYSGSTNSFDYFLRNNNNRARQS